MIADAFSAALQVRKGKTNKSTGPKQGTISSLFKSLPENHTKLASSSSGKAKNSPGAWQEKRNDEKRSVENEELNEGIAKKSKTAPKCKFLPQWKDEFPWVVFQEDQNVMTCKICCSHMWLDEQNFWQVAAQSKSSLNKNLPWVVLIVVHKMLSQQSKSLWKTPQVQKAFKKGKRLLKKKNRKTLQPK